MKSSIITPLLSTAQYFIQRIACRGTEHWCPVCHKSSGTFCKAGKTPRENAKCVHCGALERHRLVWLFLEKHTNLFDGQAKHVLHIAPEKCFKREMRRRLGDGYITADLHGERAMIKMDITDIPYPDESFDVIYCSHVLEHVKEDHKAMAEFHRVLKKDGWAVLLVPITPGQTYENSSIIDPQERLKHFGGRHHVRKYGSDYVDRLCRAGFTVTVSDVSCLAEQADIIRMGLTEASGEIYYCTKT